MKILFFLFTLISVYSQNSEISKLLSDGENAYNANDYEVAKMKFREIIELDSLNNFAWFDLGIVEFSLGNKEDSCECFYKSYKLGNLDSGNMLKEICQVFRNGKIASIAYINEQPRFVKEDEDLPLFVNNRFNPEYEKLILKETNKSRLLKKINARVLIGFHLNEQGFFDGNVVSNINPLTKMELIRIIQNSATYTPPKHDGLYVEIWENLTLTLDFRKP